MVYISFLLYFLWTYFAVVYFDKNVFYFETTILKNFPLFSENFIVLQFCDINSMVDPGVQGMHAPSQSNFFHFHAVCGKKNAKYSLVSLSGISWICYWNGWNFL